MRTPGNAYRVSICISEEKQYHGQAMYMAVFEFLRKQGAAGATVVRAVAGFGVHSHVHTATIPALSTVMPMVIEWIDTPQTVERLMPEIRRMVDDGLITVQQIQIIQ